MLRYHPDNTPAADALTDLIRAVLRMASHAERAGNALSEGFGLTSARWLLLGEVFHAPAPLTVSGHARRVGQSRQAVQRQADELAAAGLVRFDPNPADRRADQVALTEPGRRLYQETCDHAWGYTDTVSGGFTAEELGAAVGVVERVAQKMADAS